MTRILKIMLLLFVAFSCENKSVKGDLKIEDVIHPKKKVNFDVSYLNLSNKQLDSFINISKYDELDSLDLSNNLLYQLDSNCLRGHNLKYLNISHNHVKELTLNIRNLRELVVSNNELEKLYLYNADSLQRLDCSNNKLFSVFIDEHSLRFLNLLKNPDLTGFNFSYSKIAKDSLMYDNYQKFLDSVLIPID